MAVTGEALATSLGLNGGLCALFLTLFSFLRVYGPTRRFFAPKRFDPEVAERPRRLRNGLWSWVAPVAYYPEDEVVAVAGLDVAVFLRLLKYGCYLFAFASLWCCIVLMPINGTGGNLQLGVSAAPDADAAAAKGAKPGAKPAAGQSSTATEIDMISASNIPSTSPGNHRLWAHLISVYVISLVALKVRCRTGLVGVGVRLGWAKRGGQERAARLPRPTRRRVLQLQTLTNPNATLHTTNHTRLPPTGHLPHRPPWTAQLLHSFSKDVSKLRARFLSTLPRGATSHSVLVTDVPGLKQGTFG